MTHNDDLYVREQMMLDERACREAVAELESRPVCRAAYSAFCDRIMSLGPGVWRRHIHAKQNRQFGHLNISQDTRDMEADRRETLRRDYRDGVAKHFPG